MPEIELVDVIDENDDVVEIRPLDECKRLGLLHRAITVFVLSPDRKIYLQQRSFRDDWLPGMWTASCTGHVRAGELPIEAAKRELVEELGIQGFPSYLFKFVAPRVQSRQEIEHEMNYVFECVTSGKPIINIEEVEQVRLMTISECREFVYGNRVSITPDTVLSFEKYKSEYFD
ncbi:MAG: NUDIX domain-containing protein [Nitrososphaerota archaeon]|nr:NUDIX domain-containing protein [Nitrososphaerota archaeon]